MASMHVNTLDRKVEALVKLEHELNYWVEPRLKDVLIDKYKRLIQINTNTLESAELDQQSNKQLLEARDLLLSKLALLNKVR